VEELPGKILAAEHARGDGSLFPAEFSMGTFRWRGQPMKVAVVRDLTERRRLEKNREEAFPAVSHEMRTPLTAVLGCAQFLLENPASPARRQEYLGLIVKEGQRLKWLIDNLLSLQRMRAGFGLVDPAPVRHHPLLCEVAEGYRTPLVRQRIEIEGAADVPPVWGDTLGLQEALTSLLDNAVKYSPAESTIVLGATWRTTVPWSGCGIRDPAFHRISRRRSSSDFIAWESPGNLPARGWGSHW